MPTDRIEVRLVDAHPGSSRKEVARFKNVKRPEAIQLLAGAQVLLWGRTSMWRCELRTADGWRPFGPTGRASVRKEMEKLSALWHPMDDLTPVGPSDFPARLREQNERMREGPEGGLT